MSNKEKKSTITFNYIKADNFHSMLASGVIGGITVNSLIDMNFFTDRVTIPQKLSLELTPEGKIAKEINRESKDGTVREVQFGVLMDVSTAKNMIEWLNEKIRIIEETKKSRK